LVFQQMLPSTNEAPSISFEQHSRVVSMDQVLARLPRGRPVRLYPVTTRNNVMWEAVQQAFAFFSTNEGAAAAGGGPGGTSAAGGSSAAFSAAGASAVGDMRNSGLSESLSSIQALNLTAGGGRKQQQQQGLQGNSSSNELLPQLQPSSSGAGGSGEGLSGLQTATSDNLTLASAGGSGDVSSNPGLAVSRRPSRLSTAASTAAGAADSPTRAAAAAAAGSQLMNAFSSLGSGLRGQSSVAGGQAAALSGLTDILEIRTDVDCVRMISSPDQPPQVCAASNAKRRLGTGFTNP
jgi:hypothetical protein